MRKLVRPWTEEDDAQLRRLLASGASAARASVAMKRNMKDLRRRASKMGMPFPTLRLRRKRFAEAEAEQRQKEGEPLVADRVGDQTGPSGVGPV